MISENVAGKSIWSWFCSIISGILALCNHVVYVSLVCALSNSLLNVNASMWPPKVSWILRRYCDLHSGTWPTYKLDSASMQGFGASTHRIVSVVCETSNPNVSKWFQICFANNRVGVSSSGWNRKLYITIFGISNMHSFAAFSAAM